MALDPSGNIYVTGRTNSSGAFSTTPFPITAGAFQTAFAGGATDAFVFKVGDGRDGECTITGTQGNDSLTGTPGPDVICGLAGRDRIDGNGGGDTLLGGSGNDLLTGGGGNDALDGGDGVDAAAFRTAPNGVTVNLLTNSASGQGADSLTGIERVVGSRFADLITGNEAVNGLSAGGGGDEVHGKSGNDNVNGGSGNDTLTGEEGNDRLDGSTGTDSLTGGPGTDSCINGETTSGCE
jgi:Ca2+-binding RTX toxin-like protein